MRRKPLPNGAITRKKQRLVSYGTLDAKELTPQKAVATRPQGSSTLASNTTQAAAPKKKTTTGRGKKTTESSSHKLSPALRLSQRRDGQRTPFPCPPDITRVARARNGDPREPHKPRGGTHYSPRATKKEMYPDEQAATLAAGKEVTKTQTTNGWTIKTKRAPILSVAKRSLAADSQVLEARARPRPRDEPGATGGALRAEPPRAAPRRVGRAPRVRRARGASDLGAPRRGADPAPVRGAEHLGLDLHDAVPRRVEIRLCVSRRWRVEGARRRADRGDGVLVG